MKKIIIFILVLSMGLIIYFFIIEQFNGIVLTNKENIFLSVLYLIVGISVLILARINFLKNKKT
jgi:putative copper export protein